MNPKLNLGCGLDYREGYINVDNSGNQRTDLEADVTWLKSITDNSCAEAVAQDVLEHLPRSKCPTALAEWNRVLMPGGTITIRVPSLIDLLAKFREVNTAEEHKKLIHLLYGTQAYTGDFHLNGFTEQTLRADLVAAGFRVISMQIEHGWLLDVVAIKERHVCPNPILRLENDLDFIEAAYRLILKRPSDPGGKEHYAKVLKTGIAREAVMEVLEGAARGQG